MSEMSATFNFDDFEGQINEALAENQQWVDNLLGRQPTPPEIGSVIAKSSFELELLPE